MGTIITPDGNITTSDDNEKVSKDSFLKKILENNMTTTFSKDTLDKLSSNKQEAVSKYKVIRDTPILKRNPNKKDMFGDNGTDIVGNLKSGDIIKVVKKGGGGRGVVMTPYLFLSDDTYIIGYNASPYDSILDKIVKKTQSNNKKPINYIIASAVVLGIGYYIYRKFKK